MSTLSPRPPRPPRPRRPSHRRGFEIAIICALTLEADAIEALFDHHWDDDGPPFDKELGDPNAYSTGVIGRFNVVLAYMPGMGKVNAATVASNCGKSFPGIKLALVVGICGAVPFGPTKDEIVLGDVIISNGVIQYDFGRQMPGHFVRKDTLVDVPGRPNLEIRGVLTKLKGLRYRRQLSAKISDYLDALRQDRDLHAEYPGSTEDRLFEASYRHTDNRKSCEQLGCDGDLVSRSRLAIAEVSPTPAIHFGLMASGDAVMKSGEDRDRIAAAEGIIAFEMEGAGVWDSFPCIVIKGACDYADSHKSKDWQRYAAATAAACAKALLNFWVPSSPLTLDQPVFHVPFLENHLFVGRDDVLMKLKSLLFQRNSRKVALVGLGGIGKTQIALQLAYWMKEKKQDYSVFWVPALSRASFEQACVQIIDACDIPTADNSDAVESVRQYLSSKRAGKWLLVVDNADDAQTVMDSVGAESAIYRSLPQSDEGRTLFTTRYRKVAVSVAGRNIVEVPAMSPDEATSYFKEALIQEISSDEQVMNRLLTLLTHLPLAITQAAAYLNENQISLREYVQLFEKTDRDKIELLSAEFQDDTRYEQSQDPVATTWFISFNQIRNANELASRILMFLSCVEPKAVPQSMLPKGESQQQLTRAIGTLCGYRFLDRRGSGEVFDMHSLVHLAIRSWVAENNSQKEQSQAAIARLREVFPTDEWENREIWRRYMPHAIKLLRCTEDDWSGELCELGYWAGRCLRVDGRVTEGVKLLEHVVAVKETTLAENHPDRLASQHTLAMAYEANGQIKKAVELLEHQTILTENHPDRLVSQHELAMAYEANGQIKEAVELLEHVVAIGQTTWAENHPNRLTSQHALAGAYQSNGQIKKAVELLEHIVTIRETTLAENHPNRLALQHALAGAYRSNGQIKEAVELLEYVVAIEAEILAEDDHSRQLSKDVLQACYERLEEASSIVESEASVLNEEI
ncbi:hypothetical protein FOPG_16902 [Fusarium oxysporum f. sp. conglutinans race 2 54008]|uniref:Uncharacterized protein n=1 Tax=Fusarium oxysporum f. sp. conglutinans race 2 54008 TaxID=1089457 RepID=X0H4Q0_FUSOX|nr:hypothetical protein FOPG_16902 [Fusarium oxysporum f. sp. conglutinans race 2 54008]